MDREKVRALLEAVARGATDPEAALRRLSALPFEDLGFARLDVHRALRQGVPETVFCPGKTPAQTVAILQRLADHHENVLANGCDSGLLDALAASCVPHRIYADARIAVVRPAAVEGIGLVAVVSAGTADQPVAEEVTVTAEVMGNRVERFFNRLKQFRRIATRYDKLGVNFFAFVKLASMRIWLRSMSPRPSTSTLRRISSARASGSCASFGAKPHSMTMF